MSDRLRAKAERMAERFTTALGNIDGAFMVYDELTREEKIDHIDAMLAALKAEQPEECPEGFVDVPVHVRVWENGAARVWEASDVEDHCQGNSSDSAVTIRAPKPAPVEDLGIVEASDV